MAPHFPAVAMEKFELPCPKHGSHQPFKMRKKWAERNELPDLPTVRTREAFCPEDVYYSDPLGWWTGHRWLPIPGRDTQVLWCPWDRVSKTVDELPQEELEGPRGRARHLLCAKCRRPLGKVNRWGLREPLYKEGQAPPEP